MRRLLRVAAALLVLTVLLPALCLFDVISLPTGVYRGCGVLSMLSLFAVVYARVWLISYRRKPLKVKKR